MKCRRKEDCLPVPSDEPGVMLVPLTKGLFAKIDAADYDLVAKYVWCAEAVQRRAGGYYAATKSNGYYVGMHRLIAGTPDGMVTDHRNGDTLDNRRANLRHATGSQNNCNRRGRAGASSQFVGVRWNKESRRWRAAIQLNGRQKQIGVFTDEIEAAKAYDAAARVLHGEFARLNFGGEA